MTVTRVTEPPFDLERVLAAASGERGALELLLSALGSLAAGIGIYDVSDPEFRVVYLNDAARRWAEDDPGASLNRVYPQGEAIGMGRLLAQIRDTGVPLHLHHVAAASGRLWDVDGYPVPGTSGPVHFVLMLGIEVTEQVMAQRRLRTGIEVAIDLASSLEVRQVMSRLMERTLDALGADRGSLTSIEGGQVVMEASLDRGGEAVPVGGRFPITSPEFIEMLETGEPMLSSYRIEFLPPEVQAGLKDVKHTMTLPLALAGRIDAAISVSRRSDRPFSPEDVAMAQQLGTVAVLAIRNARLFQAKSDFMNMAAHELRTPLSVVNGYLSMLQDGTLGPPSEDWRPALDILADKTRELGRLIDSMLTASRLESGTMPNRPELVDLVQVAAAAAERLEPRAGLLGAGVEVNLPERPVLVEGDPEHVGRILDNLINNALTYGGETPEVTISVSTEDGFAKVAVEDRGWGIPEAMRERIFDQFVRIEDPERPFVPGTGLGLYIARRLALEQGGSLRLERTRVEQGSAFALRLPLARQDNLLVAEDA